jgi:hypothetical protein
MIQGRPLAYVKKKGVVVLIVKTNPASAVVRIFLVLWIKASAPRCHIANIFRCGWTPPA